MCIAQVSADLAGLLAMSYSVKRSDSYSQAATVVRSLAESRCSSSQTLLALGAGSGEDALEAFLGCPSLQRVVAVESSDEHFHAAIAALRRLASAMPARFAWQHVGDPAFPAVTFWDYKGGVRKLEFRKGDLLALPPCELLAADIVVVHAKLAIDHQARLQKMMSCAKDGCCALLRSDLGLEWCIDDSCFWHELKSQKDAQPNHEYFIYDADRMRAPSITLESARDALKSKAKLEKSQADSLDTSFKASKKRRGFKRALRSLKSLASLSAATLFVEVVGSDSVEKFEFF